MEDAAEQEIHEETWEQLAAMPMSNATPPPWEDSVFNPEAASGLIDEFIANIREMRDVFGSPDRHKLDALLILFSRAATWGWDAAMNNGPTAQRIATSAAAASRKAKAEQLRTKVRVAFERAAAGGSEPDLDAIAIEFRVSRSTVYRALENPK